MVVIVILIVSASESVNEIVSESMILRARGRSGGGLRRKIVIGSILVITDYQ